MAVVEPTAAAGEARESVMGDTGTGSNTKSPAEAPVVSAEVVADGVGVGTDPLSTAVEVAVVSCTGGAVETHPWRFLFSFSFNYSYYYYYCYCGYGVKGCVR